LQLQLLKRHKAQQEAILGRVSDAFWYFVARGQNRIGKATTTAREEKEEEE